LKPPRNQDEGDGADEGKPVLPSKEIAGAEEEDSWEDVEEDPGDDEESKQAGSAQGQVHSVTKTADQAQRAEGPKSTTLSSEGKENGQDRPDPARLDQKSEANSQTSPTRGREAPELPKSWPRRSSKELTDS